VAKDWAVNNIERMGAVYFAFVAVFAISASFRTNETELFAVTGSFFFFIASIVWDHLKPRA